MCFGNIIVCLFVCCAEKVKAQQHSARSLQIDSSPGEKGNEFEGADVIEYIRNGLIAKTTQNALQNTL